MKTPEMIKKGLELHRGTLHCDGICPYDRWNAETGSCIQRLMKDTVEYIQQLETRLAQAERERDAAVEDLKIEEQCSNCKNYDACQHEDKGCHDCFGCEFECPCSKCQCGKSQYEWRGPCEGNTHDQP